MISSSSEPLSDLPTPPVDQRRELRHQAVYLPCCLRLGRHCTVGLIRNVSANGLMIETELKAEPGVELDYFQDSGQWRRARVIWREERRIGLETIDDVVEESPAFPYRAIRIPTSLVGRIWLDGKWVVVGIGNLSHRGVLAFGVPPISQGQLMTLTIAGREFPNTSLRWWAEGSAGLRFERPVTTRALTELIEQAGRAGMGLYYERRVAELLEVIPANDASDSASDC
jgi:hypothetical protein